MKSKTQRKKLIVDSLHLKALIIIVIYILITLVVSGLFIFLPSFMEIQSSELNESQINAAKDILFLQKRFWPAIFIVVAILGTHSLFLSKRLFGPLYRFRTIFDEVAKGNFVVNTNIRKNDFLNIEEEGIQNMVSSLNIEIKNLKSESKDLAAAVENINDKLERVDCSVEDLRKDINEINRLSSSLESKLEHFMLEE